MEGLCPTGDDDESEGDEGCVHLARIAVGMVVSRDQGRRGCRAERRLHASAAAPRPLAVLVNEDDASGRWYSRCRLYLIGPCKRLRHADRE